MKFDTKEQAQKRQRKISKFTMVVQLEDGKWHILNNAQFTKLTKTAKSIKVAI